MTLEVVCDFSLEILLPSFQLSLSTKECYLALEADWRLKNENTEWTVQIQNVDCRISSAIQNVVSEKSVKNAEHTTQNGT